MSASFAERNGLVGYNSRKSVVGVGGGIFGAIIFGTDHQKQEQSLCSNVAEIGYTDNKVLDGLLQRLWQSEQVTEPSPTRFTEEQIGEDNFLSTYRRDRTGRFVVTISLKSDITNFGSSGATPLKRNQQLKTKHCEFMRKFEQLGHMIRADTALNGLVYYIPHHCVNKKFRVVFDGSCITNTDVSVNDVQLLGAKSQKDLL